LKGDHSYVLNEVITAYLEIHQWQIEEIQKGLTEDETEGFNSDAEVNAMFLKLTHAG
jgi:RHH-type transcriptional regulator, rel operon repressor / antitoxin RelB